MPHVTVVEKMKQRNPGSEPQVGTRVAFIIVKNNEKLMSDKAEDPKWAQMNKLAIDYMYYFEHQLEKPIEDLLRPHVGETFIFEKTKSRKITDFFIKK
jgi:DNA polymerase delta subunit 1